MRKNLQHQAPRVKGEGMLVVSIRGANYDYGIIQGVPDGTPSTSF